MNAAAAMGDPSHMKQQGLIKLLIKLFTE